MTEPEEDDFIYELLEFFFLRAPEYFRVDDAKLWYQRSVQWVENSRRNRLLQGLDFQTLVARELTLILKVAYFGNYTDAEIGGSALNLIQDNASDFVIALRGTDTIYFTQVDAIQAKMIEDVTLVKVAAPTPQGETQPDPPQGSNAGGASTIVFRLLRLPSF